MLRNDFYREAHDGVVPLDELGDLHPLLRHHVPHPIDILTFTLSRRLVSDLMFIFLMGNAALLLLTSYENYLDSGTALCLSFLQQQKTEVIYLPKSPFQNFSAYKSIIFCVPTMGFKSCINKKKSK